MASPGFVDPDIVQEQRPFFESLELLADVGEQVAVDGEHVLVAIGGVGREHARDIDRLLTNELGCGTPDWLRRLASGEPATR